MLVHTSMYWYVHVPTGRSMYSYREVQTGTYWYVHVCTMYLYIPGHTSMSYVGEVGTGSSMYWYVLVHTSMYWYVHVRTVYNGIYYHVYLWVHAIPVGLRPTPLEGSCQSIQPAWWATSAEQGGLSYTHIPTSQERNTNDARGAEPRQGRYPGPETRVCWA